MDYREYEALSDEQLLAGNAAGDRYAAEVLIARYKTWCARMPMRSI